MIRALVLKRMSLNFEVYFSREDEEKQRRGYSRKQGRDSSSEDDYNYRKRKVQRVIDEQEGQDDKYKGQIDDERDKENFRDKQELGGKEYREFERRNKERRLGREEDWSNGGHESEEREKYWERDRGRNRNHGRDQDLERGTRERLEEDKRYRDRNTDRERRHAGKERHRERREEQEMRNDKSEESRGQGLGEKEEEETPKEKEKVEKKKDVMDILTRTGMYLFISRL